MFIALTGGIGCGKSAALECFAQCGFRIADADRICHRFYEDQDRCRAVIERFPQVADSCGNIDRRKLGNIVFRDESVLKWLEDLIAPFLADELEKLKKDPVDTVIEVPLLFEKDMQNYFDLAVCVWSPFALRRQRLAARNWDHAECSRRERLQWDPDRKLAESDFGIINAGSMQMLEEQCRNIAGTIKNEIIK